MIDSTRYVQHANRVTDRNGMCWAGVMPDGDGLMQQHTVYADRDAAIRVWRNMTTNPRRVCELLGIDYDDAVTVDVGKLVEERRSGDRTWRIVGVAAGCHDTRVLNRRKPPDWVGADGLRDKVQALMARVGSQEAA